MTSNEAMKAFAKAGVLLFGLVRVFRVLARRLLVSVSIWEIWENERFLAAVTRL